MVVANGYFWTAPITALVAVIAAVYYIRWIHRQDRGTEAMIKIQNAVKEGSLAFIKRQYSTIGIIGAVIAGILFLAIDLTRYGGKPYTLIAFLIGVTTSLIAGAVAMIVAADTNARSTEGARRSKNDALVTAFRGGLVMGLLVVSLSLLGISVLYFVYSNWRSTAVPAPQDIIGFAFGASFAALFAQLGGGIYTKAADVGADLVGKVEAGIPEDDPRNPAVIADNVGDAVGDCAGRGADLFESITGENIGGMIVGLTFYLSLTSLGINEKVAVNFIIFPLVARGWGLMVTLLASFFVRLDESEEDPMTPLRKAYNINVIGAVIVFGILIYTMLARPLGDQYGSMALFGFMFGAALLGLFLAWVIMAITDYYTNYHYRPVKSIAEASKTGAATNIITGLSVGMESTAIPTLMIIVAIMGSFIFGERYGALYGSKFAGEGSLISNPVLWGVYASTIATMAMLSVTGMILAMDGYGPIADQAGGVAEMADVGEDVRRTMEALDAVGNTTKALAKGYGMASAGLAALLLFQAYLEDLSREAKGLYGEGHIEVNITNPHILMGALVGAMLPFIFTAMSLGAVGRAAKGMIEEVRRQFREIPGILEGTEDPDYGKCVDVSTKSALREMIIPSLLVTITPVLVGIIFGAVAVAAFIIGATFSGIMLGFTLNNSGGAWDNAKKLIEAGQFGGKGSEAHKAAVVGDTVGDPAKDTSGPSIHVLVKLINTVALVFIPVFIYFDKSFNISDLFDKLGL